MLHTLFKIKYNRHSYGLPWQFAAWASFVGKAFCGEKFST